MSSLVVIFPANLKRMFLNSQTCTLVQTESTYRSGDAKWAAMATPNVVVNASSAVHTRAGSTLMQERTAASVCVG